MARVGSKSKRRSMVMVVVQEREQIASTVAAHLSQATPQPALAIPRESSPFMSAKRGRGSFDLCIGMESFVIRGGVVCDAAEDESSQLRRDQGGESIAKHRSTLPE